jgi:hypothetical protein
VGETLAKFQRMKYNENVNGLYRRVYNNLWGIRSATLCVEGLCRSNRGFIFLFVNRRYRLCGDNRMNRQGRLAQAKACLKGCGKGLGATRPYDLRQGIIPCTLVGGVRPCTLVRGGDSSPLPLVEGYQVFDECKKSPLGNDMHPKS